MTTKNNKVVIDTNIAIVANGKSTHVSIDCELACIEYLEQYPVLQIVLDESGLIMGEYSQHLSYAGQPGAGDIFFKYLHDHQYADDNITLYPITASADTNRGFEELPVNSFDPSDRKILAVAVVANANVVNATDSDWEESKAFLDSLNVRVTQLCPDHKAKKN